MTDTLIQHGGNAIHVTNIVLLGVGYQTTTFLRCRPIPPKPAVRGDDTFTNIS